MPEPLKRPATILVVDDNAANAKLLDDILTNQGYAVVKAGSGSAALAQLESDGVDLVLLDVLMPGMNGYEVCAAIRGRDALQSLPVVMVTSLDAREERIRGLEAGADDFLTKPIDRQELMARVRSLLRIKQLHDQTRRQAQELAQWAATLERRVAEGVEEVARLSRLKRFFSPHIAELIVHGETGDPLQSRRREVAVVYLDLRGFTAFAETSAPEEVMQALSRFHAAIGGIVHAHEATLERFTGDGMMIVVGDPVAVERPALAAVRLAVAIRDAARQLARAWEQREIGLGLSVGVALGYATVGAIGFEGRFDYGVIGTVTNLASRLCQEAQAGEILVSQRVRSEANGFIDAEDLGEMLFHGFSRSTRVYRCKGLATGTGAGAKSAL